MKDNDWMVPRRLHTPQAEESNEARKDPDLRIDPQFLQKRERRKQRMGPHPTMKNAEDKPWLHFDQSIARSFPSFPDQMWTLGDVARWVIERTPEAVNGLSIDENKLFEILPEIHKALSCGEVAVFANTQNDPVPKELPAETWSVYELYAEMKNELIRVFPVCSSSADYEQHLLNLRLKRADVLRRWPDPADGRKPAKPTTAAAQNQCRRWLAEMMTQNAGRPRPKATVRTEALVKFPNLTGRGFDKAWDSAIRETNAHKWAAPGRRS